MNSKRQAVIAKLEKSIALQVRTRDNLSQMGTAATGTIELCDKIISTLKARIDLHRKLAGTFSVLCADERRKLRPCTANPLTSRRRAAGRRGDFKHEMESDMNIAFRALHVIIGKLEWWQAKHAEHDQNGLARAAKEELLRLLRDLNDAKGVGSTT